MSRAYNWFRLSYLGQILFAAISVPFCVYIWPYWSWHTSLLWNGLFLAPSLYMVYRDRRRLGRA